MTCASAAFLAPILAAEPGPSPASRIMGAVLLLAVGMAIVAAVVALVGKVRSRTTSRFGRAVSVCLLAIIVSPLVYLACTQYFSMRAYGQGSLCLSNLKDIDMAIQVYAEKHDGLYPPPEKWNDELRPYLESPLVLVCPSARRGQRTYAMNAALEGRRIQDIKDAVHTVVIFDSIPGNNLAGGPELLPDRPRHLAYNILFADGHVCDYSLDEVRKLMKWR